jgi:hypothetical protein
MADISIAPSFTEQLHQYLDGLQEEAIQAAAKAAMFLHRSAVERAKRDPAWASMADKIEVWAEDGHLVIGVRDEEYVSQAFALEYGDERRPPSPLFRSMNQDTRGAGEVMTEHMMSVYGPGNLS